jgi:hypothetical protein
MWKKMSITTENTFETALVQSLIEQGGYASGHAPDYSQKLGMFKYEDIQLLNASLPIKLINLLSEKLTVLINEVVLKKKFA